MGGRSFAVGLGAFYSYAEAVQFLDSLRRFPSHTDRTRWPVGGRAI
jgi:hypothetical protein